MSLAPIPSALMSTSQTNGRLAAFAHAPHPTSGTLEEAPAAQNDYGRFLVLIPMRLIWQDAFHPAVESDRLATNGEFMNTCMGVRKLQAPTAAACEAPGRSGAVV